MDRVCLLVNYNLYESKRYFALKLSEALQRKGIETKIIDLKEQSFEAEDALEVQRFQPDFTCSFNSFGMSQNNLFPWDIIKIPHLSILVDPVLYSIAVTNSPYSIVSCVDRFDCEQLLTYNFDRTFFLPHAIEREVSEGKGERPYDVVFLGSCYDYESLKEAWQKKYSPQICRVLDEAIDNVLSARYVSLADALASAWGHAKLSPQGVNFQELFYYLDNYTRGKDRVELIRAVKDAPVHVFGELMTDDPTFKKGWSHYLGKQKNVTLHKSVNFQEAIKILQKSKICLNSMPFFKNGSHERVFYGLAAGALPITTDSLFIKESFKDGEDLKLYTPSRWNEVNDQINALLSDENKREKMVIAGRKKVIAQHTWDNRVETLLKAMPKQLQKIA